MAVDADAIDLPDVVAEVRAAFDAYEAALLANDVTAMDGWFWDDERTVRYGIGEVQHGFAAVAAWRRTTEPVPADRTLTHVVVTAHGPDHAVVSCEFRNGAAPAIGRQMQTWVRTGDGWRVVAAHVSMLSP